MNTIERRSSREREDIRTIMEDLSVDYTTAAQEWDRRNQECPAQTFIEH